jgi:hypothetical protein
MTLEADEFIRRFLLHALPDGFHRIRHYGFLANGHRAAKLALCRAPPAAPKPPPITPAADYCERYQRLTGRSPRPLSMLRRRHDIHRRHPASPSLMPEYILMQTLGLRFIAASIRAPRERPRTVARRVPFSVIPARPQIDPPLQHPQKALAPSFSARERRTNAVRKNLVRPLGQAVGA